MRHDDQRKGSKASGRTGRAGFELVVGILGVAVGLALGYLIASGGGLSGGNERQALAARTAAEERERARAAAAEAELAAHELANAATEDRNNGRRAATASAVDATSGIDLDALIAANPLVGELAQLLGGESLLALVGQDEASTAHFLMHLYLGLGDLDAAIDLARRTDPTPGTWSQLATALDAAGRGTDAADAYVAAIDGVEQFVWADPLSGWARRLAELDPVRGLEILTNRTSADGKDPADMRLAIARSLAATGATEEARTALLLLLAEDKEVESALLALAEFDPALAEEHLRAKLATGRFASMHGQLAGLLLAQGRRDEGLAALEAGFAASPDQASQLLSIALDKLGGTLDDATLQGFLAMSGSGAAYLYAQVGNHLLESGDADRAIGYFETGWQNQISQMNYLAPLPDALMQSHPEAVRGMLESAWQSAGERDEVWGDIADHYWQLGEKALAEEAWQRAKELDPNDGEWAGKLQALASGKEPL